MTKKFFTILAMLSVASMLVLSSCTAAGVECGLIGKWERKETTNGITVTATVEITSDDKLIVNVSSGSLSEKTEYTIVSVDDHTIKYEHNGIKYETDYKDLTCDSVKFNDKEYTKVN